LPGSRGPQRTQVDYLAVLFTTTSGASGDLLGSDETELEQLVWQLVDLKNKKLGKVNEVLIRPEHSDLAEDCLGEREDSEESVSTVTGLEHALNQFHLRLTNEVNSLGAGTSVCVCTDGQLHIRQVLHPEAAGKVRVQAGRAGRTITSTRTVWCSQNHKEMCYVSSSVK
uniref:Uncharacterized protein n=1 Tax=Hucho hucho TaxID=62062 RepID=A0A4W5L181_9TELE